MHFLVRKIRYLPFQVGELSRRYERIPSWSIAGPAEKASRC